MEVISNPGVEEIHTCLLCKGINRDTKKENKEAKTLKYNICITRNHYANCLNETEEGRIFFKTTYMTGLMFAMSLPLWAVLLSKNIVSLCF